MSKSLVHFQMPTAHEITALLRDWSDGAKASLDELMPLVEGELRRIAARCLRGENQNHTLQTSALVNEAYLKLIDQRAVNWQNRAHFFALAATVMRRVLLDYARAQHRAKRGGKAVHVDIADVAVIAPEVSQEVLDLDRALVKLSEFDPVKGRIVEMRYFGGLSVDEAAEVLQVAPITVMRHWSLAKAWLKRELQSGQRAHDAESADN